MGRDSRPDNLFSTAARGGVRGAIASMAMSGMRQATTSLGLLDEVPPDAILRRTAPRIVSRVPVRRRRALVEFVHWSYGSAGGVLFGALPRGLRRRPWVGPLYGFAFWALYEAVLAPALGLEEHRKDVRQQAAVLADHLLYGAVVASSPWPHAD
ncbi:hypothetical protein AB0J86_26345 [Micromonospora sp. NPDC049559]|uniref:hypothetical protein n=1 Tax=Micromonospora sp. NPDC049559 TaxID=3155923 RepID=UPI003447C09D